MVFFRRNINDEVGVLASHKTVVIVFNGVSIAFSMLPTSSSVRVYTSFKSFLTSFVISVVITTGSISANLRSISYMLFHLVGTSMINFFGPSVFNKDSFSFRT